MLINILAHSIYPTSWNPLQWHHNEHDGVSNHQPHDGLLNRLFRRTSEKPSKFIVTGFCEGNSSVTGEFPSQRASKAENVLIWRRHHVLIFCPRSAGSIFSCYLQNHLWNSFLLGFNLRGILTSQFSLLQKCLFDLPHLGCINVDTISFYTIEFHFNRITLR